MPSPTSTLESKKETLKNLRPRNLNYELKSKIEALENRPQTAQDTFKANVGAGIQRIKDKVPHSEAVSIMGNATSKTFKERFANHGVRTLTQGSPAGWTLMCYRLWLESCLRSLRSWTMSWKKVSTRNSDFSHEQAVGPI